MADVKAIRLMEAIYARVDAMVRAILESWPDTADAYTVNIQFDGGGSPLSAGMAGQGMVPMSGKLTRARMFVGTADGASSATITAQVGTFDDYPSGTVLHGAGLIPTLTDDVKVELDITDWVTTFYQGDLIAYTLDSFTGEASHLTLALQLAKLPDLIATTAATSGRASRMAARRARLLRNGSVA